MWLWVVLGSHMGRYCHLLILVPCRPDQTAVSDREMTSWLLLLLLAGWLTGDGGFYTRVRGWVAL